MKTSAPKKMKEVSFPIQVFETAATKEELEDWLLAHDEAFIRRMRQARKEHLENKGISLECMKKRLGIK